MHKQFADSAQVEDGQAYSTVAQFVLECMVRIPTKICTALLQQVLLVQLFILSSV